MAVLRYGALIWKPEVAIFVNISFKFVGICSLWFNSAELCLISLNIKLNVAEYCSILFVLTWICWSAVQLHGGPQAGCANLET